ncbi:MAG: response regulator transcription factor [Chitinophagaceae bacterium]|jgi:DNA-binding NarL/FixJ family response regulator|nr:response regulator transcription factor [Chitinophagaceae bacterium]
MDERKISILIVDDHEMVRKTWKMILELNEQFNIVGECSGGAEAIDAAQKLQPDIILMDINMSPVNGFEATRKITQLVPSIRIIGVSINNQPTYARNIMQLGAKGYVTKNSTSEEMVEAIQTVYKGGHFICKEVKKGMQTGNHNND